MLEKYLIVNADDYGLCREISTGILKAHEAGIVTAVSVVSAGRCFEEGCASLRSSGADVGLHLTFVDGERALTGPIKGVTDTAGIFPKNKTHVIARAVLNSYDRSGLRKELYAQADRLAGAGFNVTHIDAHQHLHLLPGISEMVIEIAKHFKIPWVRIPQSKVWDVKGCGLNILGRRFRRMSARTGLRHTDRCLGFNYSGHTHQQILLNLLDEVSPGHTELIMHPGYDASHRYDWGFDWPVELAALTDTAVKHRIASLGIHLTTFTELHEIG